MEAILQVEHLTKRYPDFTLDDVSFSLPKGEVMGLIGENGAGKSTTIHALLDLICRDAGNVTFWGQALSASKPLREDIGVVLDGVNFYETLTPEQVGKVCRAAYRQWDGDLYRSYLARFALPPRKEIKALSKGMRMKLLIAAALSHRPKLLILDEATSGLDPVMRDEMLEVFWDFVQDEEHSILMSSHITTDLERIADASPFCTGVSSSSASPRTSCSTGTASCAAARRTLPRSTRRTSSPAGARTISGACWSRTRRRRGGSTGRRCWTTPRSTTSSCSM